MKTVAKRKRLVHSTERKREVFFDAYCIIIHVYVQVDYMIHIEFAFCPAEDSYLAESGWERFAEAQNCTVYRKQHQSGLYMYKGNMQCKCS